MKALNSLTDPRVSKRLNRKMILGVVAGAVSAYVLIFIVGLAANKIKYHGDGRDEFIKEIKALQSLRK